jgi:hypothetical protein
VDAANGDEGGAQAGGAALCRCRCLRFCGVAAAAAAVGDVAPEVKEAGDKEEIPPTTPLLLLLPFLLLLLQPLLLPLLLALLLALLVLLLLLMLLLSLLPLVGSMLDYTEGGWGGVRVERTRARTTHTHSTHMYHLYVTNMYLYIHS